MDNEILNLDKQLCFRLYAVSRKMTRLYKPLLDKFNLTYPQYIVMLVVFEYKTIDFNELSKIVELKTGTLTPIINKLNTIGYIDKVKNIDDHRKVFINITEKGLALKEHIIEVPISLGTDLEISEEMYLILTRELDMLSGLLDNAKKVK